MTDATWPGLPYDQWIHLRPERPEESPLGRLHLSSEAQTIMRWAVVQLAHRSTPRPKEIQNGIKAAHRLCEAADQLLADLVAAARTQGVTWTAIGQALGGVRRTAAQKRYGSGLSEERLRALANEARRLRAGLP